MAIADALRAMEKLKREGVVRDYIVFGSVAAMVHTRPFFTEDIDVGVDVESDEEYLLVFGALSKMGTVRGHAVVVHGTPIEVFPTDVSPVIHDALLMAKRKRVERMLVKVASPEHLVLEALRAFRDEDKARVFLLNRAVDPRRLRALFRRLDADGTLEGRYQALVG